MYDLVVDGALDFYARRVGGKKQLRREPLSGVVDGSNKVFLSPLFPLLATSIAAYENTTLKVSPAYSVDADLGVFTWYAAPSVQPTIDAIAVPLTTAQVTLFAWAGFHLMEALWFRNYLLSSSNSAYAMATYSDTHIYVVQGPLKTGEAVIDPVCGSMTFSTSQLQRGVLSRSIELAYLDAMVHESSLSDVDFSERVGGARVSASRRPSNLKTARDLAYDELINAIYAAMGEEDTTLEHFGMGTLPPHTDEYDQIWHWQDTGKVGSTALYIPAGLRWIQQ